MSLHARRELIQSIAQRYHQASKTDKKSILDELVAATGYHRKSATRLLNNPPPKPSPKTPRRRTRRYDDEVSIALVILWEAADRICSKRLAPFLPELLDALERHGHLHLEESVRRRLHSISPATVDRLLHQVRYGSVAGVSTTRPGSLLKHQIPVRTFADWDDLKPGFFEADLVAHCGTVNAGSYLNTLVLTDVETGRRRMSVAAPSRARPCRKSHRSGLPVDPLPDARARHRQRQGVHQLYPARLLPA